MVEHIGGVNGMGGMKPARKLKTVYRMSEAPAQADSIEFTSDVMRLRGIEGIRMDRVMAVKSQIAGGGYFTGDKLDVAMDRALDDALGQLFGGK